ncbi:hypothetical protein H696_01751 [Fonticula alba]|uniref:Methyltransferase-like protein n=1 Tax=Fonticula alba TaxID=691883 RepID=A0A058ZEK9_FONAL|nr:hypothetical protein H696_01751 [Fonticula alba]KCV72358.1 hypothetical protein H696_01751 [Fonticula alba]|eukprot:XP_009493936.1 hypothetical protein H696_01751 [Fonticula alba]
MGGLDPLTPASEAATISATSEGAQSASLVSPDAASVDGPRATEADDTEPGTTHGAAGSDLAQAMSADFDDWRQAAIARVNTDPVSMAPEKVDKLRREIGRNWDKFYMRNQTNFFRDRHWTRREFHELYLATPCPVHQRTDCPDPEAPVAKRARHHPDADDGPAMAEPTAPEPAEVAHAAPDTDDLATVTPGDLDDLGHAFDPAAQHALLLEVGCGVGNFLFPMLSLNPHLRAYACDISPRAVNFVQQHAAFRADRVTAFVADASQAEELPIGPEEAGNLARACDTSPPPHLTCRCGDLVGAGFRPEVDVSQARQRVHAAACPGPHSPGPAGAMPFGTLARHLQPADRGAVDFCVLVFVLSALPVEAMPAMLRNIHRILRPGSGTLLFRDYAQYDQAQLRFKPSSKVDDNLYARHDGTLAYYFSQELVQRLFTEAGFEILELEVVPREYTNRKTGMLFKRLFIQAKFRRPLCCNGGLEADQTGEETLPAGEE